MRLCTLVGITLSIWQLIFVFSLSSRSVIGLFSTAAEHRSAGDDCHGDDGDDNHSHSVTHVRTLETRARKLEEQVHDLTVSSHSVLFYPLSIPNMVPLWVSSLCLFSNHSVHFHCKKGVLGWKDQFNSSPKNLLVGGEMLILPVAFLLSNVIMMHYFTLRDVRKSKRINTFGFSLSSKRTDKSTSSLCNLPVC